MAHLGRPGRRQQSGASLLVILVGTVALAGTVVYMLAAPGFPAARINQRNIGAQLISQAQYIRQQIHRCASEYPEGDGLARLNNALPIGGNGSSVQVASLTCPGTGLGLWTGADGAYRIQQPSGFGAWTYQYYPATGVINIAIASVPGRDMSAAISHAVVTMGSAEAYSTGSPPSTLYVRIAN